MQTNIQVHFTTALIGIFSDIYPQETDKQIQNYAKLITKPRWVQGSEKRTSLARHLYRRWQGRRKSDKTWKEGYAGKSAQAFLFKGASKSQGGWVTGKKCHWLSVWLDQTQCKQMKRYFEQLLADNGEKIQINKKSVLVNPCLLIFPD